MKQENIDFLETHRHHHTTLIKAFYIKGLNVHEREGMLRVMREEFSPMAQPDLWCSECLADFVKDLYRRFDEWLANNTKPVEVATETVTEPIPTSIIVKTNFPKHKRR